MKRNLRFDVGDKVIWHGNVYLIHAIEAGRVLDYGIRGPDRRFHFVRDSWLKPLPALELLAECAE